MNARLALAFVVLAVHLIVILFNLFGFVAVPLGAWRGWSFVRGWRWRTVHVLVMVAVAVQASLGRACFLTLWQASLEGAGTKPAPLIMRLLDRLAFWPLPIFVFTLIYLALFLYVLALLWLVPPDWPRHGRSAI